MHDKNTCCSYAIAFIASALNLALEKAFGLQ